MKPLDDVRVPIASTMPSTIASSSPSVRVLEARTVGAQTMTLVAVTHAAATNQLIEELPEPKSI
jgi:hypothetical protein